MLKRFFSSSLKSANKVNSLYQPGIAKCKVPSSSGNRAQQKKVDVLKIFCFLKKPQKGGSKCIRKPCICVETSDTDAILKKHQVKQRGTKDVFFLKKSKNEFFFKQEMNWNAETLQDLTKKHVMMTWGATNPMIDGV